MMRFVIYREIEGRRKTLVEWEENKIFEEMKRLHGEKGVDALREVIESFKKETLTIP